jgi:hypothetical protein
MFRHRFKNNLIENYQWNLDCYKKLDKRGLGVPRSCMKDESRSLGVGLQEQASNHLKLHWLRAFVVSVKEKAWQKTVSGVSQGDECK